MSHCTVPAHTPERASGTEPSLNGIHQQQAPVAADTNDTSATLGRDAGGVRKALGITPRTHRSARVQCRRSRE